MKLLARLLIVLALLSAQQAGLAHNVWHAALGERDAASPVERVQHVPPAPDPSNRALLCDFHGALGAVLGALVGGLDLPRRSVFIDVSVLLDAGIPPGADAPAPSSRDPPLLI